MSHHDHLDLVTLKERHDLRRLVEEDLGAPHSHSPRSSAWKCPFHREQKGYSLAVWHDNWRCFGACQTGGDTLDWLQRYRGLSFIEACRVLGEEPLDMQQRPVRQPPSPYDLVNIEPPPQAWQNAAWKVVQQAQDMLWSAAGEPALKYLRGRGLDSETIQQAKLGYVPGRPWRWRSVGNLNVPCGITLPWVVDGVLWAVKVRRAAGDPKYTQILGGSAGGLYNAEAVQGHHAALFVEGEFDALLAHQHAGDLLGVVTLGSAASRLSTRWLPDLLTCRVLLVAYDTDSAGRSGAVRLQSLTQRTRSIAVPYGKDVTEFALLGGSLRAWLVEALSQSGINN